MNKKNGNTNTGNDGGNTNAVYGKDAALDKEIVPEKESKIEIKFLQKAMQAFGIWDKKFIFKHTYYPDEQKIILLTVGGERVTWSPTMKDIEPLSKARIDGISPKQKKKKKGLTLGKLQPNS